MADNPRTYPARFEGVVDAEVLWSAQQRAELADMMATSGQGDALHLPPLERQRSPGRGAHTEITWLQERICVLEPADVVVLFELPLDIGAPPTITRVRWDVVARICGADCWSTIAGLDPPRVITRRWPSAEQLDAIRALSLPELPD